MAHTPFPDAGRSTDRPPEARAEALLKLLNATAVTALRSRQADQRLVSRTKEAARESGSEDVERDDDPGR